MFAHPKRSAFSLIELVIVIVIIGIIGAIAIPRMSRGAAGAADSALKANLAMLRNAIDLFHTEHGGTYPSLTNLPDALTQYSTELGTPPYTAEKTPPDHVFGPYLRAVPPLPVGANKGKTGIVATLGGDGGWVYNSTNGKITANCADTEKDDRGVQYNQY
jgi:prepilin-type N-terminal cleavage/methylation domain-containing protein